MRAAFGVAPGVESGAEAATRSAKSFDFLGPLFCRLFHLPYSFGRCRHCEPVQPIPLEIQPVILRRTAAATALWRQQRADDLPFLIRKPDPLSFRRRQKTALNQPASLMSNFVHET